MFGFGGAPAKGKGGKGKGKPRAESSTDRVQRALQRKMGREVTIGYGRREMRGWLDSVRRVGRTLLVGVRVDGRVVTQKLSPMTEDVFVR